MCCSVEHSVACCAICCTAITTFTAIADVDPALQLQRQCPADPQVYPVPSKQNFHPMVCKDTSFSVLCGCSSKEIASEIPPLLWITIWVKSAPCSYPELAIAIEYYEHDQNPLLSKSHI